MHFSIKLVLLKRILYYFFLQVYIPYIHVDLSPVLDCKPLRAEVLAPSMKLVHSYMLPGVMLVQRV